MQYITVTDRTGAAIRISLGAVESWEPTTSGGGGGSLIRYAGQSLSVREPPEQIDAQITRLVPRP